jgi:hypothetical protein
VCRTRAEGVWLLCCVRGKKEEAAGIEQQRFVTAECCCYMQTSQWVWVSSVSHTCSGVRYGKRWSKPKELSMWWMWPVASDGVCGAQHSTAQHSTAGAVSFTAATKAKEHQQCGAALFAAQRWGTQCVPSYPPCQTHPVKPTPSVCECLCLATLCLLLPCVPTHTPSPLLMPK